jgi:hypothetical protein
MRGMKPFKLVVTSMWVIWSRKMVSESIASPSSILPTYLRIAIGCHRSAANNGKPSNGVTLKSLVLTSGSQLGVGDIHIRKIG